MNIIEKRRRKAWAHATMVIMNKVIREASTGTIFIYGETLYGEDYFLTPDDALDAVLVTMGVMVLHISMPQLVEEVPRPLRNVMDAVALTSVFAGALTLLRFKEETFDDMPPSIRDVILSHFFMSDVEIAEIEAEKEQNKRSIERSREELEMEAKATLAKFNNRAPKRTFGTEKQNA